MRILMRTDAQPTVWATPYGSRRWALRISGSACSKPVTTCQVTVAADLRPRGGGT